MYQEKGRVFTLSFFVKGAAISLAIFGLWFAIGVNNAKAQAFSEDFAVVPVPGWTTQNNSVPVGTTGWFQGNSTVFPAQAGAPTAYIGANFSNTTGSNTISNWLISPNRTFSNGDVIRFWTRTPTASPFADRLQLRLSLAGAGTDVGTGPTGLGTFTTLLRDINPTYMTGGVYPEVWTQFTNTISGLAGPTSGRIAFRYFVEMGGPTGNNSNYIGIDTFSYTPAAAPTNKAPFDFDGDNKTDLSIFRPGPGEWWFNRSSNATTGAAAFGTSTDKPTPVDFTGDGRTDIAFFRPGTGEWFVLRSENSTFYAFPFGISTDTPMPADYDGDGKSDAAVFRSSTATWYISRSAGGTTITAFGIPTDKPVAADYDGDGRADIAIYRANGPNAEWWIQRSTAGLFATVFGVPTDKAVAGDYTGDGKADVAVWRPSSGTWFVLRSEDLTFYAFPFGISTDTPVTGDYDGDGRFDAGVFRSSASTWYVQRSTAGTLIQAFGTAGDQAVPNVFVR